MNRALGLVVGLSLGASAFAQSSLPEVINLERFSLNPSGNGALVMSSGELLPAGELRGSLGLQYANNIALTRRIEGAAGSAALDRLYGNLATSYGILEWLQVDLQVPLVLTQGRGLTNSIGGASTLANSALGQPILSLRGGISEGDLLPVSLSLELGASIPLGDPAALVADVRPTPLARLNIGKNFGSATVFGEVSFVEHVDRTAFSVRRNAEDRYTDEFGFGVGVASHLFDKLSGEAAAQFAFDVKAPGMMSQLHLGLRYQALGNVEVFAAGGPAFGSLMATPDLRVFGGIALSGNPGKAVSDKTRPTQLVEKADKCASPATGKVEECPDADFDSDGVANKVDNCPMVAEDKDGFADEDGCVDADNDGDAIADAQDKCPNEAGLARLEGCPIPDQDKDGIADADDKCVTEYGLVAQGGCPIKDQDNDGVVDSFDGCPSAAGLMELKGCPAKDTDTDGLADHLDNCPAEKGLANNSGCPARKKQLVVITRDKLEIKDRVYFGNNNARIQARSFKLLKQIAQVLKDKQNVEKVVIEGHTDDKGNDERNLKLSQDRADAVRSYLIKQGVEGGRLEAKGFGRSKPIDTNKTNAGRANNRRVEFTVPQPVEDPPAS
ncbi:MAG: OmpA family protein [Gemmatimonadota bacterium]|nr:OmpA family protein [Gemmatimonadota bacterium]